MLKEIEIVFRRLFLAAFLFIFRPRGSSRIPLPKGASLLLIRLNRIGDALVTTPLIATLAASGYRVTVLADSRNAVAFYGNTGIAEVIIFRKGITNFISLLRNLNAREFDAVVDLHDDVSTTVSLLVAFLAAPRKYALAKQNARLFTATMPKPDPVSFHVVNRLLALLPLFGISAPPTGGNIVFKPADRDVAAAEEFLRKVKKPGKLLLGINISAGSMARFWGVENFRRLLQWLTAYPVAPFIITSGRDIALASQIASDGIPVFCSPSFGEFAAVVMSCGVFFTPDTAAIHLASVTRVPVFGLYVQYKTDDIIWSPYASPFAFVLTREPVLSAISFEEVIVSFQPFLEQYV